MISIKISRTLVSFPFKYISKFASNVGKIKYNEKTAVFSSKVNKNEKIKPVVNKFHWTHYLTISPKKNNDLKQYFEDYCADIPSETNLKDTTVYFFQSLLFYLSTKDQNKLEELKISKVFENLEKNYENLLKNEENDLNLVILFLQNLLVVSVLKNLKTFETRRNKLHAILSIFERNLRGNLVKPDQKDFYLLETLILFLAINQTFGISYIPEKETEIWKYNELAKNLFKKLEMFDFYKTILIKCIKNNNKNLMDLASSDILLSMTYLVNIDKSENSLKEILSFLMEIHSFQKFSIKHNLLIFKLIRRFNESNHEFSHQFSMFLINLIKSLSQNLEIMSLKEFATLIYLVSRESPWKYSFTVVNEFWLNVLNCFVAKYHSQHINKTLFEKTIIYTIGKEGYISKEITEKVIKLEFNNFLDLKKVTQKDPLLIEKYTNIMKSGINLKIFSYEDFDKFMKKCFLFWKGKEELLNIVFTLSIFALRFKYFEKEFWEIYFSNILNQLDQEKSYFTIYQIYKIFELLFKGNLKFLCENPQTLQEIQGFYLSSLKQEKIQEIINKDAIFYSKSFTKSHKEKNNNGRNSLLENIMNNCIELIGTHYLPQAAIEFMIVDFLLPKENIVVEVLGPTHFIKTKEDIVPPQLTYLTEFKINCLKALGYNVISLNPDEENANNSTMEKAFLKKYNEIISEKLPS